MYGFYDVNKLSFPVCTWTASFIAFSNSGLTLRLQVVHLMSIESLVSDFLHFSMHRCIIAYILCCECFS